MSDRATRWVMALTLFLSSPALGANLLVDSTADEIDANPGDGICASASGACTVRAAVIEANALAGADVVEIPAGDYELTIPGLDEEAALTGDLDVIGDLEIRGTSGVADEVVLHGDWREPNFIGRVLDVQAGAALIVRFLTISDTLSHRYEDADDFGDGAAIRSNGTQLLIEDSFIARNRGPHYPQPGAVVTAGSIEVRRSRFFNNRAAGSAGAISASNALIEDSEFLGNVASSDAGAIYAGSLTVRRSQFAGNASGDSGAAIFAGPTLVVGSTFDQNYGNASILDCDCEIWGSEFVNNTAGVSLLGAVYLANSLVTGNSVDEMFGPGAVVWNTTISTNMATLHDGNGPVFVAFSTVLENTSSLAGLRLFGSIVSNNLSDGLPTDCNGTSSGFVSDGYNAIDVADNCTPTATDQFGDSTTPLDVGLAPLADNGGPTRTHALLEGSPAIDWIPPAACLVDDDGDPSTPAVPLATDQREVQRPQRAGCDAGAYEAGPPACSDGIDNDGDGRADYPFDTGCTDPADDDESPPDSDGDGVEDPLDNCLHFANPTQSDVGGVGASAGADGIGDACQCGDVNGNGSVTTADATLITRALLLPPTATLDRPDLCNVGGSAACTTADAVILTRGLLVPPTATVQQSCAPALP